MWACREGHLAIAHYLITQGAEVYARDNVSCDMNDEWTIFMCWYAITYIIYLITIDYSYESKMYDNIEEFMIVTISFVVV